MTFPKYAKKRILEITLDNRLKCLIFSLFVSMRMSCLHAMSISEQKLVIQENHVRLMKLYRCGRFDSVYSRKYKIPRSPKLLERCECTDTSKRASALFPFVASLDAKAEDFLVDTLIEKNINLS